MTITIVLVILLLIFTIFVVILFNKNCERIQTIACLEQDLANTKKALANLYENAIY